LSHTSIRLKRVRVRKPLTVRAITRGYYEILIGEETVKTDEEVRLINEKLAGQGIAKLTTQ